MTVFPSGLHGDEAITGLEGRRILDDGWIGVYSPLALGQPTGPLYLTAVAVWLLGDTILAVRAVPATVSLATVAVLYLMVRERLGVPVAVLSSALLATMGWHIHFGRIGFPLGAWPLVALVAVWALLRALETGKHRWWVIAGAAAGAGVYVYHAHTLLLGLLGLFVVQRLYGWLAASVVAVAVVPLALEPLVTLFALGASGAWLLFRSRRIGWHALTRLATFSVSIGLTVLPMARFAADPANGYFNHAQGVSLFEQDKWTERQEVAARGTMLAERYARYWIQACCHPEVDGVDASGIVPSVPVTLLALAALGLVFWRRAPELLGLGMVVILAMPLAAVVTVGGLARRTFVIAPFLAVFAAVGVVSLLTLVRHRHAVVRVAVGMMVLGLMASAVYQAISDQFETVHGGSDERWVFAHSFTEAVHYLRTLPDDHHVYFYADRWSVDYETRQYLAPDVSAEDRSREYGDLTMNVDADAGRPVFVFVGTYRYLADRIRTFYPDGEMVVGDATDGGEPAFVAYVLTGEGPWSVYSAPAPIPGVYGPAP